MIEVVLQYVKVLIIDLEVVIPKGSLASSICISLMNKNSTV